MWVSQIFSPGLPTEGRNEQYARRQAGLRPAGLVFSPSCAQEAEKLAGLSEHRGARGAAQAVRTPPRTPRSATGSISIVQARTTPWRPSIWDQGASEPCPRPRALDARHGQVRELG